MTSAGSISGQIRISAKQAIAEYAALRAANAATRTALLTSSAAFAKVGVAALAGAAPIALLFSKAISSAATFQKKIDYFGAVTGASRKDMQAVADKALEMGKTTVFSADQMADAFVEFGKAGISTRDILNGVADATVNLAQAADISVGEASNIMASQLATFQLGAKGAGHVADVLAGAANASIIDVSDLAYSLKYAGGIAASTGVSFDSLVTAISLLGQRGIKGSTAGTSLRQIMVSLTGSTAKATKQLKAIGIITKDGTNKFVDATGHIKSLSEVFQILQNAEKGYTDAQQLSINKNIFNTRALSAVQILMRDGAKGFVDMQNQINKVSASDVAHKRLDNLAGDWTRLKNTIQTVLIQVGTPLQNFMRRIVQGLTGLVRWFGNLSPGMQQAIIYGLGVVGAFLAIVGVLSLTISLVLKVIQVYKDLKAAFIVIRTVTLAMSASFRAAAVALLTNPVFLIIAGLAALVIAIIYCWKHFKTFRDVVKAVWHAIEGFFKGAWEVMKKIFDTIVKYAKETWDIFYKVFVEPWIIVAKAIAGAFTAVYKAIVGAVTSIINWVKGHWKWLALLLGPIGIALDIITTHWTAIKNFIMTVVNAILTGVRAAWNTISSITSAIWNAIVAVIETVVGVIVAFFTIQFNIIKTIITTVWGAIQTATIVAWNVIKTIVTTVVNVLKRIVTTGFNAVKSVVTTVWHAVASIFSSVYHGAIQPVINALKTAINSLSGPLHKLHGVWNAVWNAIKAVASAIWNHGIKPIFDGVLGAIDKIGGAIGKLKKFADKIKGFFGGIAHGIGSVVGKVGGFLGLASGGWVPGRKGDLARNVRVHGGEYVLSTDMLSGRAKIDPRVLSSLFASQRALSASTNAMASRVSPPSRSPVVNLDIPEHLGKREYNFPVYNPVAEKGSDSIARRVRTLAAIGAF